MSWANIEITPRAREKLASLGVSGERFIRLRVVAGGCSGMSYEASIDSGLHGTDLLAFEDAEIRIFADSQSMRFLDGIRIDYEDDLIRGGFKLSNPNAASSCGCGSSFAPPDSSSVIWEGSSQ